jgi:glyceraldehyde 3-phosphate dehydrogenase
MGWRFGCQPPNVSLVDLVIELEQEATVQDVNQALKEASNR